ncbi:putative ribonuclease H-like domain-containing protein [Tanacetum coccineum]
MVQKPAWNNNKRVNHENKARMTHSNPKENIDPKAVLTRSGPVLVNVAKQNLSKAAILVNTARPINTADIRPKVNVANKMPNTFKKAHSYVKRPFYKTTAKKNSYYTHRVNTVRGSRVNTARHIVKTARPTTAVNATRSRVAVKTTRPKAVLRAVRGNLDVRINPEQELKERGIFDSGCSRHMIGNKSYLTDFEDIDGGFVAFGGNSRGGKISGKDFKLADENHVLLKVPRRDNMYSVDLKKIIPKRGLTCLYAKATSDEANLCHRRIGHTCVACQKRKQQRASCKAKVVSSICQPLQMLNMDLFGPTFLKSLMKKTYCLVVIDDFSRFTWVFFLATKDETAGILKSFITGIENLIDLKQNGVVERKNMTLIEATRTMLVDSKLPTIFWTEAVNTARYVQNRVLVVKPHNKTPYELFLSRKPALGFMRPFGCLVTNLNTIDHLGKFDGKADERFFVGYSTNSKAFRPVFAGNETNGSAGTITYQDAGKARMEKVPEKEYILLPLWGADPQVSSQPKTFPDDKDDKKDDDQQGDQGQEDSDIRDDQDKEESVNSINILNTATSKEVSATEVNTDVELPDDPNMPLLEDIVYSDDEDGVGAEAVITNLDSIIPVSPIPITRIHKDHPLDQIIGDVHSVWTLVDPPNGKRAIGTKWVYRNKKDERGIVVRNKARLVAQGHTQEEGIDYDEVFAPVARIEAIRLFLAYASLIDFTVYQMDVKSAFLYDTIEEEVEKALYGLHQAPRAWYETLSTYLLENGYRRGTIDKTLFIKKDKHDILLVQQKSDRIFINQDKYVAEILNKFDFTSVKTSSTPMETNKALVKDSEAEDVDVHLYRSMIGSLMYLTASRPDIMFAVCACARFQVTLKISHLHAVKRIFRYLKGQLKLGLWYPKDSPFDLEAYSDSDYAGTSLDRKSTTTGCQFLGKRLISWQCKKQTIVANLTTEAEYVAAANCYGKPINLVVFEVVYEEMFDSLERAATTATSLEAEQDSCGRPKCQEHMGDIHARTSKDLMLSMQVNAVRHNLMLMEVNAVRHTLTTVKKVNEVAEIQALVDGKQIVVSEATIRRLLKFNDEGGMDCLPNATIFKEIARMGYEKLTQKLTFYKAFLVHNETIICLSTNQQFNFSKFILEGMIRTLDAKVVKFLMYPRFVQLFVNQLEGLPVHNRKYKVSCHTKKIFANLKRKNKDFSGNDTPLFPTMVVQAPPPTTTTTTPPTTTTTTPVSTSTIPTTSVQSTQPSKQRIRRRRDNEVTQPSEPNMVEDNIVPNESNDPPSEEDRLQLNELMNLCTTLQAKVLELEKTKASQQLKIESLDRRVKKLEKDKKKRTPKLKRLYKVGLSARVISSDDEEPDLEVILVDEVQRRGDERNEMMFDVDKDLSGEEVMVEKVAEKVVEKEVAEKVAKVSLNDDEITLAQTLQKLKSTPKAKGVAPKARSISINEPSESHRADIPKKNLDKGKGKMVEPEKPLKRKDQILLDEEEARRLQAIIDEEAMIAKEGAEKEAKLVEDWDNKKAKMDTHYELASKL